MDTQALSALLDQHKITLVSTFIPWSQSRNKSQPHRSLNWTVAIMLDGRPVLDTDYSAGIAHCPAYSAPRPNTHQWREAINWECEHGRRIPPHQYGSGRPFSASSRDLILPNRLDVLYSLIQDSSVLESRSFEDWAADFGFDPDSRSAEKMYRDCLANALRLRAGLGPDLLQILQIAFQDY